MNRLQWQAQYRANRTAYRLWDFLCIKTGKVEGVPSFVEGTPGCLAFDCTRLRGDHLGVSCFGHTGQVTHRARMNYLRQRVRLPA